MEYRDKDRWLFNMTDEEEANSVGWYAAAWLILLIVGSLALNGCDSQAAANTAQDEQEAHEKKLELLSMPITWTATVTQCDTKNGCRTRYYLPSKEHK